MNDWAVFTVRCNTIWCEYEKLTEEAAKERAAQMSLDTGWPHYAAPRDMSWADPYAGLTEEEYYQLQQETYDNEPSDSTNK